MGNYASIDYELLKKQRAEGWTMDRLAQEHGVSRWTIAERLRRGAHTPKKRRHTGFVITRQRCAGNAHTRRGRRCVAGRAILSLLRGGKQRQRCYMPTMAAPANLWGRFT